VLEPPPFSAVPIRIHPVARDCFDGSCCVADLAIKLAQLNGTAPETELEHAANLINAADEVISGLALSRDEKSSERPLR
jgi:hypothetical protein